MSTRSTLIYLLLPTVFFCCLISGCAHKQEMEGESAAAAGFVPAKIDYNFHVKPILSDRCYKCHGPDENSREAGLRLDTQEGAMAALGEKKDHFAIVPGDAAASTLVEHIFHTDSSEMMPPPESNLTLAPYEKEILKKWIEQGAEWKTHWAFIPPQKTAMPEVKTKDWAKNEVDLFILRRLEQEGLQPNDPATREQLVRRVSFDLTGLPPTMEILDAFLKDDSPDAYEKLVDQLLDSDAFAEHMATQWMDIARYADTHGYQDDLERIMWPWRDWVIHAYRENLPYDKFVKWQLAGDLLPDPTKEQIIATAFNRNHKITQEGGVIPEEYRTEYVADRTQTFATAFLGLTMECARCHDHKYDPLSQKEYYQLFAYFNNIPEKGLIQPYGAIPEPFLELSREEVAGQLQFINNLDTLKTIKLMVMQELPEPRSTFLLRRGVYDQPGDPVAAATPAALGEVPATTTNNRLALADWLLRPEHPLTARVAVNRLWQQVFGRGIVATPEDFGSQGALPSHPGLLDYLAVRFVEEQWDVKSMLKLMVSSATYRQSAVASREALRKDPQNILLARAPRLRLSAEMVRDQALAVSGLLQPVVGGPSVKPYQPPGLWEEKVGGGGGSTAKYVQDKGAKLYRRSMYTFWKRTVPPPSMMTFDATTRDFCAVKRQRTSTPLQALVTLNDPQVIEACRVLTYKAVENSDDPTAQVQWMFRRILCRNPSAEELNMLTGYFQEEFQRFESDPEAASALLKVGEFPQQTPADEPILAALTLVANTIINLDEAVTKS